jgi:hypothetical protein
MGDRGAVGREREPIGRASCVVEVAVAEHMVEDGKRVLWPRGGCEREGAGDGDAVTHERSRTADVLWAQKVQGATLIVWSPTTPVRTLSN